MRISQWSVIFPSPIVISHLNMAPSQIHIPDCDAGWLPTQHVRIRILAGSGMFESHPFTITNAPVGLVPKGTDRGRGQRGITLFVKVSGDWSRKLNGMAREKELSVEYASLEEEEEEDEEKEYLRSAPNDLEPEVAGANTQPNPVPVKILIDGPYGGLKLDMVKYHSVMLIAGGSGITFVMGCVEECLRRREEGRGGMGVGRVEVVWVVRDMSRS